MKSCAPPPSHKRRVGSQSHRPCLRQCLQHNGVVTGWMLDVVVLRHLIRSHKKEKKKKRLFPRYSHLGPKIVGGRSERDIKLGIKNLPGFCFPKEKPKYTISCRIKYDGIEEGSPTSGCQKKRTENSSELYTRQERCPGGEGRGWYVGEPCN